jgi:hypothetical protein
VHTQDGTRPLAGDPGVEDTMAIPIMLPRACAWYLTAAVGLLSASGPALAQDRYPDLTGTWVGEIRFIGSGKSERDAEKAPELGQFGLFEYTQEYRIEQQHAGGRFSGT